MFSSIESLKTQVLGLTSSMTAVGGLEVKSVGDFCSPSEANSVGLD